MTTNPGAYRAPAPVLKRLAACLLVAGAWMAPAAAAPAGIDVVAIPGGPATKHTVNAKVIEALGPKGYLINIARGSVIDEQALVDALISGKLGGAGLDVFQDEPRVPEALFALDTVVLQPHVGSATTETRLAMGRLMVDNLLAYFADKPLLTPV